MTPQDLPAFSAAFQDLRLVFPLRAEKTDLEQMVRLYFRSLARFPIDRVNAGAEIWRGKGNRFPKIAEWIAAIPRGATAATVVYPELTPLEAREYRTAVEDMHYEDEPCPCVECKLAGVSHRFLRYVPDVDTDGRDLRGMLDGKIIVRGRWIHGAELARWYVARDHFTALMGSVKSKRPSAEPLARALDRVTPEDEFLRTEPRPVITDTRVERAELPAAVVDEAFLESEWPAS